MIFDRTANDVFEAERIFNEKVKAFFTLSEEEKSILEKGRVTAETLNRIENKQAEIGEILVQWEYLTEGLIHKTWGTEVFTQGDLLRIVNNLLTLRDSFYVISSDLAEPRPRFHFEDFNIIEKTLAEIEELVSSAKKSFLRSGAVRSAQRPLPLKGDS